MRNKMHLQSLKIYQSRRFYMDEYPEQDELRDEFFDNKTIDCFFMQEVTAEIAELCNNSNPEYTLSFTSFEDGITYYFDMYKEEPDKYFENRWLKRN